MLAPSDYFSLQNTCDGLGGELTWFETTQEFDILSEQFHHYVPDEFHDFLYTSQYKKLSKFSF